MSRHSAYARIWILANLLLPGFALSAPFTYIQSQVTNKVSVIDTANGAVVATMAVGAGPQINAGVTVNLVGARVYAVTSRKVSVIDTTTGAVIATIPPSNDYGIAVNPAGTRVYETTRLLNNVSVINAATDAIIADVVVSDLIFIDGVTVNPVGMRIYVADALNNVVIAVDAASNSAAAVGIGGSPYTISQFTGPPLTSPATTPNLNQHGLTGSWYDPATSGQGFAVEVFPNQSPGSGQAFVSWFTFDTVIGGAGRQRWYTLQGEVATGQPNAALTIYQNTGGNFNAPPATDAEEVGTATLSFDTCSRGELSYSFTDGSGRAGAIPLTRLLPNVTCSVTSLYPTNADFALSGSWYAGAATAGQGFTAEVAPDSSAFFLSWFTYRPTGTNAGPAGQRWYTAQGAFTPGLRTIPVQIYETTGGMFDTATPPGQGTVVVGTGTMTFQSCSAATFNYAFTDGSSTGSSGTIVLRRIGPVPPGCAQ